MGQGSSSCWTGIERVLASGAPRPVQARDPANLKGGPAETTQSTASQAPSSFKCRRFHRTREFGYGSDIAGFLEHDPILKMDSPSDADIPDKIASVLYAHINRRVFSSPEDDEYHIGHFTWDWLSCIKTHSRCDVMKKDISDRLRFFKKELKLSDEILVISLIYIERLLETKRAQFTPANWDVILTTGVVLASKVSEDIHPWNIDFQIALSGLATKPATSRGAFSSRSIYLMESKFLKHIEFNVHVNADAYAHYHFNLTEGGGNPTEMLEKIEEEIDVSLFTREDSPFGNGCASSPTHFLDLCMSTRAPSTGTTTPSLQIGPQNGLIRFPAATPAGFGRLDPANPYVGTFQHATPAKKPNGSWLSGDLSCLCNMQGTCHICVRRSKIAFALHEESSMRKCASFGSVGTAMSTTPESPDDRSCGPLLRVNDMSTATLTGATGRYLAQELLKQKTMQSYYGDSAIDRHVIWRQPGLIS